MSTVWTTGWEALPANLSSPSLGPAYIRGLKTAIHERMWNEHGTYSNASSGADGSPGKDWVHKAGSAVTYFVTTTPTKRPDASTAFTTSDTGRMWVNSTSRAVKALSGTAFAPVSSYERHKFLNSKYLVTSIGSWNMGGSTVQSGKFVYLYFSSYPFLSQMLAKRVSVIIQSDGGNCWWPFPNMRGHDVFKTADNLHYVYTFQIPLNYFYVRLIRGGVQVTSPYMTKFTNTGINRGWVVIEYV